MKPSRETLMAIIARKKAAKQSTVVEQRDLVTLTVRQMRREIREERKRG